MLIIPLLVAMLLAAPLQQQLLLLLPPQLPSAVTLGSTLGTELLVAVSVIEHSRRRRRLLTLERRPRNQKQPRITSRERW